MDEQGLVDRDALLRLMSEEQNHTYILRQYHHYFRVASKYARPVNEPFKLSRNRPPENR